MERGAYVYILICADSTFYTGSTTNLAKRILEHLNGEGPNYTRKRLPIELIYHEEYQSIADAFHREKQIQGWCRAKKIALMDNDYSLLKECSKSKYRQGTSTLCVRSVTVLAK